MNIVLYGNGSSGNHGCEAIVRGTVKLLGTDVNTFRIQSGNPLEDKYYGLNAITEIFPAKAERKKDIRFLSAYSKLKLTGNYTDMDGLYYLPGIDDAAAVSDIALSVGGDNYFLVDYAMELGYRNIPAINKALDSVPFNNVFRGYLGKHLNDEYSEAYSIENLKKQSSFYKLDRKQRLNEITENGEMTVWSYIKYHMK